MRHLTKADFHLHTYHSDNQDRMTPQDYVTLGRRLGYDALGFCDHHHNLTQAAWQTLQAEVEALSGSGLLLSTGYEATFVVGHLCVLNRRVFDGESVAGCRRALWSPANTRILAHPDNNACAWLLPLPVGVQGVEVINGGQDLYAYRPNSPCNGLTTYQRYLLLNHPVAAVAQSDCHVRALFGRVWTGLALPPDAPRTWTALQDALARGHSCAVMGDLPLSVWAESGAIMGDPLAAPGDHELLWEVAPGSEVTVFVADRPVAYFLPNGQSRGHYRLQGNGPHWLLAKRGLAWAVSSPIWVQNQPADAAAGRARLAQERSLLPALDGLRRRLDALQARRPDWERSALPVAGYMRWLQALLPDAWPNTDWGWDPGRDAAALAHARLEAATQIATPLLAEVIRAAAVTPQPGAPAPRAVIAAGQEGAPGGLIQFSVDVPRDWAAIRLYDESGTPLTHLAQPGDGPRDPIDSLRTRLQAEEIYVWLAYGEMHEYVLRDLHVQRQGTTLTIQIDLYPEELGLQAHPDPAAAAALAAQVADPELTQIYVHLRMPRRFGVVMEIDAMPGATSRTVYVRPAGQEGEQATAQQAELHRLPLDMPDGWSHDPAASTLVVQVG